MIRFSAVHIIFFYLLSVQSLAQFSGTIDAEAGYFKTTGEDLIFKDDLVTRLNGQLKLNYARSSHEAFLTLNIHPEYLGRKNKTGILKLKADGGYLNYLNTLNWGFNISVIKNNYFGDVLSVQYNIFSFQPFLLTTFLDKPLSIIFGYTYQNINYSGSINYDLVFNETQYFFINERYFTTGVGIYTERFNIENEYDLFPSETIKNEGWRTGPQINIKYIKNFLISSSYRVLLHFSNAVENTSYEHQVTLIAGKILFEKYSIFALADFYFRDFRLKSSAQLNDLIYNPINQENKYSLKLAYELSNSTEIFIRSGYSRENVDSFTNNIAGWTFTLGFTVK